MPIHVFVMNQANYDICMRRGVVGIPAASPGSRNEAATNDALISRMCIVKRGDCLLFYVTDNRALHGIWQADGAPFYDESPVWPNACYPYRVRFKNAGQVFPVPLRLHDIFDLQHEGKVWSFSLTRASGSNAMFSLSDGEARLLLGEYCKVNPYAHDAQEILEPYPLKDAPLLPRVHLDAASQLKYEAGLMAYLSADLTQGRHRELLGNYTDYMSYVPTTIGSEMDILLLQGIPSCPQVIASYNILELKRDLFDEAALSQLISYETWFLKKMAHGDQKMVRATAIARRFAPEVMQYVDMRRRIEGKPVMLLRYGLDAGGRLTLAVEA